MERSGLIEPYATPEAAARALVGVQAQILPAAGLALWNRSPKLTNVRFEELLYRRRSLVHLWGQRGTLHVYDAEDWPLLHGARTMDLTWWEKMAADANSSVEDYRHLITTVAEALRARETMNRTELRALNLDLPEELFSPWGGIFADLVRLGYACHAGRAGGEGQFAHRARWLPDLAWNPPDSESANLELLRRYIAAYGPARAEDFAHWRGTRKNLSRRWVEALGDALTTVTVDGAPMLALSRDLDALAVLPDRSDTLPVRMLYRFDPYLLAHDEKDWVVAPEDYDRVWVTSGHINGVVLFRGRAVAIWRYDRKGKGILITVSPFRPLPRSVTTRLMRLAEGVARYFASPLEDLVVRDA